MAQPEYVTDPDILAKLNSGEPEYVTDPDILARLNEPEPEPETVTDPGILEQLNALEQRDTTRKREAEVRSGLRTTDAVGLTGRDPGAIEGAKAALNRASFFGDKDSDMNRAIAQYGGREAAKRALQADYNAGKFNSGKNYDTIGQIEAQDAYFRNAGITDPKEMDRILSDAAKESQWTEKDDDNVRVLSTGDIVLNPGRVFGDYEKRIEEINRTAKSEDDRKAGIARLDRMRAAMADRIDSVNSLDGDYNEFAAQKADQGVTDKIAVIDEWAKQQDDRNWVFKTGDAALTGMQSGAVGVVKTGVGTAAGAAALVGADETAASLGGTQNFLNEAITMEDEAAGQRGVGEGFYGAVKDTSNSITQMAPMFAGGYAAKGLSGAAQLVTQGMAVYGWAGAQGYESKLTDAVESRKAELGGTITPEQIAETLGDPRTQIAAVANGAQTAMLAKILGGGTEAAALGKASGAMTVRDFLTKGGRSALKDSTLKAELGMMARAAGIDATDEFVEEWTNTVLDKAISSVVLGEDFKLGDVLEESLQAGAMGAFIGGALPQVRSGDRRPGTTGERSPEVERAAALVGQAQEGGARQSAAAAAEVVAAAETVTDTGTGSAPPSPTDAVESALSEARRYFLTAEPGSEDQTNAESRLRELEAKNPREARKVELEIASESRELTPEEKAEITPDEQNTEIPEAAAPVPVSEVPTGTANPENAGAPSGVPATAAAPEAEAETAVNPAPEEEAETTASPPPTPAPGVTIDNVDDLVTNGGGTVSVLSDGRKVDFEQFGLAITDGIAEVAFVRANPSERGKGIGLASYEALGRALAAKGISFQSSGAQYGPGRDIWMKLAAKGLAVPVGQGKFRFTNATPTNETAVQVPEVPAAEPDSPTAEAPGTETGVASPVDAARKFSSAEEFGNSLPSNERFEKNNANGEPYRGDFVEGELSTDPYGENPYIYRNTMIDPKDLIETLGMEGLTYDEVVKMPSTQTYIQWYREGNMPPPINVGKRDSDGKNVTNNRRRVVAAIEAGVAKIPAMLEVGRRDDIFQEANGKFEITERDKTVREQMTPQELGESEKQARIQSAEEELRKAVTGEEAPNSFTNGFKSKAAMVEARKSALEDAKNSVAQPDIWQTVIDASYRKAPVLARLIDGLDSRQTSPDVESLRDQAVRNLKDKGYVKQGAFYAIPTTISPTTGAAPTESLPEASSVAVPSSESAAAGEAPAITDRIPSEVLEQIKKYPDFYDVVSKDALNGSETSRYLAFRKAPKAVENRIKREFKDGAPIGVIEQAIEDATRNVAQEKQRSKDITAALALETPATEKARAAYRSAQAGLEAAKARRADPKTGTQWERRAAASDVGQAQQALRKAGDKLAEAARAPAVATNETPSGETQTPETPSSETQTPEALTDSPQTDVSAYENPRWNELTEEERYDDLTRFAEKWAESLGGRRASDGATVFNAGRDTITFRTAFMRRGVGSFNLRESAPLRAEERTNAGIDGSGRVTITIADGAILDSIFSGDGQTEAKVRLAKEIEEELIHAAHLVAAKRRVSGSENIQKATLGEISSLFGDLISQATTPEAEERIRQSILSSIQAYNTSQELRDLSLEDLSTRLDERAKAVAMAELVRQVVQLRKDGLISEAAMPGILQRVREWFGDVLSILKQIAENPASLGGRFRREIQDVEGVMESLKNADPSEPKPYSPEALRETFGLTEEQGTAADALLRAMGLDPTKLRLKRGGTPGGGALNQKLAEMDVEYLAAVEAGDMETAQRLVDAAAKAAGYSVGPVYHGTEKDFTEFQEAAKPKRNEMFSFGFHFTDSKGLAGRYGKNQMGAFLRVVNPLDVRRVIAKGDPEWVWLKSLYPKLRGFPDQGREVVYFANELDAVAPRKVRDALRATGYDGLIYDAVYGEMGAYGVTPLEKGEATIVLDPSQIKSAEPVTYDADGKVIPLSQRFNPQSDSILYQEATEDPRRHAELEAKHAAGTITPEETAEAQAIVERAAKAAGYTSETLYHTSGSAGAFTEFRYAALPGGEDRYREGGKKRVLTFALEGLSPGWFTSNSAQFPSWKNADQSNVVRAKVKLQKPLVLQADPFAREEFINRKKELSEIRERIRARIDGGEFMLPREFDALKAREKELSAEVDFSRATEDEVLALAEQLNQTYTKKGVKDLEKQIKKLSEKTGTPEQIRQRRRELPYADPFYGLMSLAETAKQDYPDLIPGAALRAALMAEGYDGVILEGTNADTNLADTTLATWVIPFVGGAQIKSAEPFTYETKTEGQDADGTVSGGKTLIPLSERFNPESDSILYQQSGAPVKGAMEVLATGDILLRGLTAADFSTAVHEISHAARRMLLDRSIPEAQRQGITDADIATAEQWAGATNGVWNRAAEEKFARGFEAYLRDGKAPTQMLAPLFQKMGEWLKAIYSTVKGTPLDVAISDEMRAVYDKLVTRNPLEVYANTPAEPLIPPPMKPRIIPDAKPEPNSEVAANHAYSDAARARLGLPPRWKTPAGTNADLWASAIAAEDEFRRDNPGSTSSAGSDLLTSLMNDPSMLVGDSELALLLHEVLRREEAVETASRRANDLPASTEPEVRSARLAEATRAQQEYDDLLSYLDAAGTEAGRALQARKMVVKRDYSLAAMKRAAQLAKNSRSDRNTPLTAEENRKVEQLSRDLLQKQAELDFLKEENVELRDSLVRLTEDVSRAQAKARALDVKSRSKIRQRIAPKAAAARERLAARGVVFLAQGTSPANDFLAQEADASMLKDLALVTSEWLVDKLLTPTEFAEKLARTVGSWVSEHAERIYTGAKAIYHESESSVQGMSAPSAEEVLAGVDTTGPEPSSRDVGALARAHVIAGIRGMNVLDNVLTDLQTKFPDLTREDVARIFTKYGQVTYPSREEVPKEIAKLKALELLGKKIADLKAGRPPLRTGFQRGERDAEIRELEKEFRALLKETGIQSDDPARQLQSALGAAKRRMENEIEELQRAIDAGKPRVANKSTLEYDEAAKELQRKLADKRAEYALAFPPAGATEAGVIAMLDRQIAAEEAGVIRPPRNVRTDTPEIALRRQRLAELRQNRRDLAANPLEQAKAETRKAIERLQKVLEAGIVAVRNKTPVDADAELEALRATREALSDEVAELRRASQDTKDREIARALAASEKALARLEAKLASGDLSVPVRTPTAASRDAAVIAVRERLKELNRDLNARRRDARPKMDPEEARIKRALASIEKRMEVLRDRLARRDASPLQTPRAIPLDSPQMRQKLFELETIKMDFVEMQTELSLKNATVLKKFGFGLLNVSNIVKTLTLSLDMHFLRQLGAGMFAAAVRDTYTLAKMVSPSASARVKAKKEWARESSRLARTLRVAAKAFMDPQSEWRNYEKIRNRPLSKFDKALGLKILAPRDSDLMNGEDIPRVNSFEKIPWWVWPAIAGGKWAMFSLSPPMGMVLLGIGLLTKPAILALDRAQRAATNEMRASWADAMIAAVSDENGNIPLQNLSYIGNMVMAETGRGASKVQFIETFLKASQPILLSPRWYFSRIQVAFFQPVWKGLFGDRFKAKENRITLNARKAVVAATFQATLGRATVYASLAAMFGVMFHGDDEDEEPDEEGVNLNPTSSKFGSLIVSRTRINITQGSSDFMVHAARLATRSRTEWDGTKVVLDKDELTNEVIKFWGARRNPLLGLSYDTYKGAYYGGEPVTFQSFVEHAGQAIIINDIGKVYDDLGPADATLATLLMWSGGKVNVEETPEQRAQRKLGWAPAINERERANRLRELKLNFPDLEIPGE